MDTLHLVDVSICLRPIFHADPPEIKLGPNEQLSPYQLTETRTFNFRFYSRSSSILQVKFCNKNPNDTVPELNLDKVVVVESVSFFGITDPRFAWAGVYHPEQGGELVSHTYLSWNGTWTLNFDVPVFTWMHRVQGLGWIYQ